MPTQTIPEKKTRISSMKWIKLGEGKDPEFNKLYFLFSEESSGFDLGTLDKIEETEKGKKFIFRCGEFDNEHITHYAIPTKPAE